MWPRRRQLLELEARAVSWLLRVQLTVVTQSQTGVRSGHIARATAPTLAALTITLVACNRSVESHRVQAFAAANKLHTALPSGVDLDSTWDVLSRIPSDNMASPLQLVQSARDSQIVITDAAEPFFHLLDLPRARVRRSFGRRGRADGETLDARAVFLVSRGKPPFAYELRRRRVFMLEGDTTIGHAYDLSIDSEAIVDNPVVLADGRLALTAPTQWSSLLVSATPFQLERAHTLEFREAGDPIRFVSNDPDSIPSYEISAASSVRTCAHPSDDLFVRVFRTADRIDVLESVGFRPAARLNVPFTRVPTFHPNGEGSDQYHPDFQHFTYLSCEIRGDSIFALYSGESTTGEMRGHGRYIHVFHFAGQLSKVIVLPEGIADFEFLSDRSLLGVQYLPRAAVLRFARPTTGGAQ